MAPTVVFFGSFQAYSVQVLAKLAKNFTVTAVITTPPAPKGRHLELTPTEVAIYSKTHNIPLFELDTLNEIPTIDRPDFLVVAGYGKLIPPSWLDWPKVLPVNMHPSLVPAYRGRCPAEWAILHGEAVTGVTLIKMTPDLDRGPILPQSPLPVDPADTRLTLYTKLYALGADLLVTTLPKLAAGEVQPLPQPNTNTFYARQITREDGFVPWVEFNQLLKTGDQKINRLHRALGDWPGVWTTDPPYRRVKFLSLNTPL